MSCECSDIDDLKIIQVPDSPQDAIDVRGVGDLRFTVTYEGGVKVFTGQIVPYVLALIVAEANPTFEVGATVGFTWNLSIFPGSNAITARAIDPSGIDISVPVAIPVVGQTRTTAGVLVNYTITVTDDIGGESVRILGITFYNKVYTGFSYKDGTSVGQVLTQAEIKALVDSSLSPSIFSAFGGVRNYGVPNAGLQQYVYWAYPSGTNAIASVELSNLPFPIVFIPGVTVVTNVNGQNENYILVRSASKFSYGTLSLDLK